jgi:hypothetical protein
VPGGSAAATRMDRNDAYGPRRSQINLIRASRFDTQVPAATSVWNTL